MERPDYDAIAGRLLKDMLRRTHLSAPADLSTIVREEVGQFGGTDVAIYLADHEQRHLQLLDSDDPDRPGALDIEGTLHGRAFATSTIVETEAATPGRRRLFLPLLDGTERLGTMEITLEATDAGVDVELVTIAERFSHFVAQTMITKGMYGDVFETVRRTRPMSVATELINALLPPMVFATVDLVIAGMVEPAYDAGGDTFDYAVNNGTAHVAIFDAMGHGLAAAGDACFAVAAYRSARRAGLDLVETYITMDAAIRRQPGERFVTAIMAELDRASGELCWISAGHPAPLLVRDAKFVKTLEAEPSTPLGVAFGDELPQVATEYLQPGDAVLLYTDGVPEARLADGEFFTAERFAEFIERQAATGYSAPETLRRLRHAILEHQHGRLQDDATALIVEWARGGERKLVPQTVD